MVKVHLNGMEEDMDVEMTVVEFQEFMKGKLASPAMVSEKPDHNSPTIATKPKTTYRAANSTWVNVPSKVCTRCSKKFHKTPKLPQKEWESRTLCTPCMNKKTPVGEKQNTYYTTAPKKVCATCGTIFPKPPHWNVDDDRWKRANKCSTCREGKAPGTKRSDYVPTEFPDFRTIRKEQVDIFKSFIRNVIGKGTRFSMQGDGGIFGFNKKPEWESFVTEFMMLSDEVARYFSVPNRFFIKETFGGYNEITYKKEGQ